MKQLTIIITCLFLSLPAWGESSIGKKKDTCGIRTRVDGTVFTLTIENSFQPSVVYQFCARQKPEKNFILITITADVSDKKVVKRSIKLDNATSTKISELYELALEYDVKDDTMGFDGSIWCLETSRGFTYSKACFWTPEYNTDKRHLRGLVTLGFALRDIKEGNQ